MAQRTADQRNSNLQNYRLVVTLPAQKNSLPIWVSGIFENLTQFHARLIIYNKKNHAKLTIQRENMPWGIA